MSTALQSTAEAAPEDCYIPDKVLKAERRIAQCAYDVEAWSVLIRDAQTKKIEEARVVYERLVTQFIDSGRYWKIYVEHEMKSRNYDMVEKLFQRCLVKVLHMDLWRLYLAYIKETKSTLATYREKMAQAYDFALDKIGFDIMSYQIWADYIAFLKSCEAVGSYAENQRISAVRKVYQRGVNNPMLNIELLWKDYCNFEHAVNPLIAKKMQDDRGRDYMNARRVAKEFELVTKGLNKNAPSVPPQNLPDELKQVELWKKYIVWERSNPLHTEDLALVTKRVLFAYEQCILCLDKHPDVWIEAATYLETAGKQLAEKGSDSAGKLLAEESSALYERATTTTLKSCVLLYFAYADFEETRMKYDKVHSIYKRIAESPDVDPSLVFIQYMRFARRVEGMQSVRNVFRLARECPRITHHVYVACARMEYYCNKDPAIAFKIFDLAFKKFGAEVEFIKEYIDFLTQLNEDNNTRVLFERVLSSGQLPSDKSLEVMNKFQDFEVNVGDLSSVLKVERRRMQLHAAELEGKETALLVNRYRYLDLLPCQPNELKAIGYQALIGCKAAPACPVTSNGTSGSAAAQDGGATGHTASRFPRPDTAMMLPFKPRMVVPPDSHPVPGGVFPPPPAIADLLAKMPPPFCFSGPFVIVDKLLEHFLELQLPEEMKHESGSLETRLADPGTQFSLSIASGGRKRKIETQGGAGGGDSDDEGLHAPPANDIYRLRQQKKFK